MHAACTLLRGSDPAAGGVTRSSRFLLFEFTSAFSNVGLSIGNPGNTSSYSGALSVTSRVLIMATMLMGKHRALPRKNDTVVDFNFVCVSPLAAATLSRSCAI